MQNYFIRQRPLKWGFADKDSLRKESTVCSGFFIALLKCCCRFCTSGSGVSTALRLPAGEQCGCRLCRRPQCQLKDRPLVVSQMPRRHRKETLPPGPVFQSLPPGRDGTTQGPVPCSVSLAGPLTTATLTPLAPAPGSPNPSHTGPPQWQGPGLPANGRAREPGLGKQGQAGTPPLDAFASP